MMEIELLNIKDHYFHLENNQLKLNRSDINDATEISSIDTGATYEYFLKTFLIPNVPCIISNIDSNWKSKHLWLLNKQPNFEYLSSKYGEKNVTIYNCSEKYFNSQKTSEWSFSNYLNYWITYKQSNYSNSFPLNYLKDWHLALQEPSENFYQVPKYFSSDWLNEYFEVNSEDDYKFVYMGPKGTWTPFHKDVFTSYSWSTNICGQKQWIFFPPGEEERLKDTLGNIPYDISNVKDQAQHIEIIQNAGDAIFVPSGWHHQVWNTEDTISINHNWINGCNAFIMWKALMDSLVAIKSEIADCIDMDNWTNHCQIMLKSTFGIDLKTFYNLLKFIALRRIKLLEANESIVLFNTWTLGKKHACFDLLCIRPVIESIALHEETNSLNLLKDVMELSYKINMFCNVNKLL